MIYYVPVLIGIAVVGFFMWKTFWRGAYESAQYNVLRTEGAFELREYPDLKIVTTSMQVGSQGEDGSFMRLFRYISGNNEQQQKIAMTTPVFMERKEETDSGQMAFVLPSDVASNVIPDPNADDVGIVTRPAGTFASIQFSGSIDEPVIEQQKAKLVQWIQQSGYTIIGEMEVAGYDAPITPGFLRRNEILFRVE
ncbi:MAG: heme-binding protein [Planctomycetota bacterium]